MTSSQASVRTTIYFDPDILKALKFKAVEIDNSLSALTNQAVKYQLLEDYEDIKAIEKRADEPVTSFEDFMMELKNEGLL